MSTIEKPNSQFDLRQLADIYESTIRIRCAAENRLRAIDQDKDEGPKPAIVTSNLLVEKLIEAEKLAEKEMADVFRDHPCFTFVMGIPGIKNILACRILGMIADPTQFARFSNLRTFAGLTPGKNKLKKGEKAAFCRRLKTTLYIAYSSMLKANATVSAANRPQRMYADIYYHWRDIYKHRFGEGDVKKKKHGTDKNGNDYTADDEVAQEWPDLRQSFAAKNKLLDVFLFHIYEEWLQQLGETPPTLYSHEVLGHHMKYERTEFWSEKIYKSKR